MEQPTRLDHDEWLSYIAYYNKSYQSEESETLRKAIYLDSKRMVDQFQMESPYSESYQLELNEFADRTEQELDSMRGLRIRLSQSGRNPLANTREGLRFLRSILDNNIPVPDELDWRNEEGMVTSVKFQGRCGSCWAFAATGALEAQMKIRMGMDAQPLSNQQILDCVGATCEGDLPSSAFDYAARSSGIQKDLSYPYEFEPRTCRENPAEAIIKDSGFVNLPTNDEETLKKVVAKFGPTTSGLNLTKKMVLYKEGVYQEDNCLNNLDSLNHAILIVGYGTDPKDGDYWLIKNSFGSWWGDNGYMRLARNKKSMCGISAISTIPTF